MENVEPTEIYQNFQILAAKLLVVMSYFSIYSKFFKINFINSADLSDTNSKSRYIIRWMN